MDMQFARVDALKDSLAGETVRAPKPPPTPQDPWQALAQARSAEQLCHAWLPILCEMIPNTQSGLLLLEDLNGSYAPAAVWPQDKDLTYLKKIAEESLEGRQGVLHREGGHVHFAYPLANGAALFGVVILDLRSETEVALTHARRLLHWGAGWLIDLFNRRKFVEQEARLERSSHLFDVTLAALAETDFANSCLATVNRLAQRFECDQVLYGLEKGKTVRVDTMSHSAWFEEKTNLINLAALAMNEAFDQRAAIVVPEPENGTPLTSAATRRYLAESGSSAVCVMPLEVANEVVGVWMLEKNEPFTEEQLELLEALGMTLGPILDLKKRTEESLFRHSRRSGSHMLRKITDTSRPGYKLLAIVAVFLVAGFALYETDYRVSAEAVVEGRTQRVVVAPFDGYINTAPVRAGDIVAAGETLAALEDKDFRLEKLRWEAELEVALRKEQEAMANGERVELRLASAQAEQARAQLQLASEKLARAQIVAPFDGVVVRGDLSQRLGSPIDQGETLFEMAPLDEWRVILKVDERDIAAVRSGQKGELRLTALPGKAYPFSVRKVTPVATAEDGRNYFRAEAQLVASEMEGMPNLRPNMEGVAKVESGRASLLWIWTHRLADWLSLSVWRWMP